MKLKKRERVWKICANIVILENITDIYITKMKDYVKRAIDNYREKNKEGYLLYQKEQYRKRKMEDKRMPEFKTFCKIYE